MAHAEKSGSRGATLALLLGWSAGCTLVYSSELDKRQCESHSDCEATAAQLGTPLVCREHACQAPVCNQTEDCPTGSVCDDKLCVAGGGNSEPEPVACEQDSDCGSEEQRCGYDGFCYAKWGCLDEDPTWPDSIPEMTYITNIRRAEAPANIAAVGSASIDVCFVADITCMAPAVGLSDISVDENNKVTTSFTHTSLSKGFHGYVRINAASTTFGPALPFHKHFTSETPLVADFVDPTPLNLVGVQTLSVLGAVYGIEMEPGTAIMQFYVADCGGRPAGGVAITSPTAPQATFMAFGEGGVVEGATATTAEGNGSLVNIPPQRSQRFVLHDEALDLTITDTFSLALYGDAINNTVYYPRFSAMQKWMAEASRRGLAP